MTSPVRTRWPQRRTAARGGGGAVALLAAATLTAHGAQAQEVTERDRIRTVEVAPPRPRLPSGFGTTLWAGRIGERELVAIGAPSAGSQWVPDRGEVILLEAGKLSWRATGTEKEEFLGWSLAPVDRVGAGVPDGLAIGAVRLASHSVESRRPGRVELRSLSSGKVLLELTGAEVADGFGSALADLGDVDGDGWAELAVGAVQPGMGPDFVPRQPGYVALVSTKDGSVLWTARGREHDRSFGATLARIGDVDGDCHDDLLVGAPGPSAGAPWYRKWKATRGAILALSAKTGKVLYEVEVEGDVRELGRTLEPAGDLDGDGYADAVAVVFGGPPATPGDGEVLWISGDDGAAHRVAPLSMLAADSVFLSVARDADGRPLIAVGEPCFQEPFGQVELLRFSGERVARFVGTREDCSDPDDEFCSPYVGWSVHAVEGRALGWPPRWVVGAPGFLSGGVVLLVEGTDWAHRERTLEQDFLPGTSRR